MVAKKKNPHLKILSNHLPKHEQVLLEYFNGRIVGGRLSQLATYADLFMKMSDAILLVHRDNNVILECNPGAASLFSSTEDEIIGSKLTDWSHKDYLFELNHYLSQARTDVLAPKDFTLITRDSNEIIYEMIACPLKLGDYSQVIQVIAKDVTEVRKARRALEEMNTVLQRLSTTDEMTGLKNFRSFKEELRKIHDYCCESKREYCVVFIDVDHFKKYNDRNGHPAGDGVLRRFGEILRKSVRIQDIAARYGGEEFVLLLPDTGAIDGELIANKLLNIIREENFRYGEFQPLGRVTASLGVAAYPEHGTTSQSVLEGADAGVYASKSGGRNQVTVFKPGMTISENKTENKKAA